MKKFTTASLKAFIRKNKDNLYIKRTQDFDGMTDCVQETGQKGVKKVNPEKIDFNIKYHYGIDGLWLVGGSRDRFEVIDNKVNVWNCCGECTLIAI